MSDREIAEQDRLAFAAFAAMNSAIPTEASKLHWKSQKEMHKQAWRNVAMAVVREAKT